MLTLLGATVIPTPPPVGDIVPTEVKQVIESARWLSGQTLSVWFAIITILFGWVIWLIIRHLLRSLDLQREAHNNELKEIRNANSALQIEEKQLSLQLLQYLEKDHSQTIVLVRENQTIMQETVSLLKAIQQDRHDEKIIRDKRRIEDKETERRHNAHQ